MNKGISILVRLFIFLTALMAVACSSSTGNQALPQSSIPAPSECSGSSCITVSAPNTSGLVTVTASAGTVPNSALVIVEINAAEAGFFEKALGIFCGTAHAQASCTLDIPQCRDVDDDFEGECQFAAEADGSFVVQVPASINDRIQVRYLDPDNCKEVSVGDNTVNNDFIPLNMEGLAIDDDGSSTAYIWGQNSSGQNNLVRVDVAALTVTHSTEISSDDLSGTPRTVLHIPTGQSEEKLLLLTDEEATLVEFSDTTPRFHQIEEIPDIDQNGMPQAVPLNANMAVIQKGFRFPTQNEIGQDPTLSEGHFCLDPRLYGAQSDRIFFARTINNDSHNHPISIMDGIPSTLESTDSFTARAIHYAFETFDSTLANAILQEVPVMVMDPFGGKGFFIGKFIFNDGSTRFHLFEIPVTAGLCDAEVDIFKFPNLIHLALQETMEAPGSFFFLDWDAFDTTAGTYGLVLIPDSSANTVFLVDLQQRQVFEDVSISPLETTRLTGIQKIMRTHVNADLPVRTLGLSDSHRLAKISILGMVSDGIFSSPTLEEMDPDVIAGVNPVDMKLMVTAADESAQTLEANLVILSRGLENDGLSNLRIIDASDL